MQTAVPSDADSAARAVGACIHAVTDGGSRKCVVTPVGDDPRTNAGTTVEPGSRADTVLVTWPEGKTEELPTT